MSWDVLVSETVIGWKAVMAGECFCRAEVSWLKKVSRGREAHRSRCNPVAAAAGRNASNAGSIRCGKQVNDRLSTPASLVDPISKRPLADSGLGFQLSASSEIRVQLRLHTTDCPANSSPKMR